MPEIDPMAAAIGEMRAELRNAAAQRSDMLASLKSLQTDVHQMRASHERMTNRGAGILIGVSLAGGTLGAALSKALSGIFQP